MITVPSEDELFARSIQLLTGAAASAGLVWDTSDKSFFGLLARAWSQLTMLYIKATVDADNDAIPAYKQDSDGTLLSRLSSAALDAWAITLGLPSGTPGVYGRKGASISTGGTGIPICTIGGTLIAAGTQLVDGTGAISVQTTADITTNGPPNALPVSLVSITTGSAARIPTGATLTFVAPPAGVGSSLLLTAGLTQGGSYRESDGDLLQRILFKLQNPGRGGTAADYRYWAESATDTTGKALGISRAYVFPLRSGTGTVDVMGLLPGSGTSRDPGPVISAAVGVYIGKLRPVTANAVNVIRPAQTAGSALRIQVNLQTYPKYKPEWSDAAAPFVILGHNAAAKTITIGTLPTTLQAAVDTGAKPRIQMIISTAGAPAAPTQARVVSYVGPILTLETFPAIEPTDGVDYIYPGGPYVDAIAAALVAYVDSLGPSRQSGFADEFDVWESDVTPARIADVTLDTRDTDGTRMIRDIPNLGTAGVLIAIGTGFFAPAKYTAKDIAGVCELAYLRSGGIEILGSV